MTRPAGPTSNTRRLIFAPLVFAGLAGCESGGGGTTPAPTAPSSSEPIRKTSPAPKQSGPQPGSADYSGKGGGSGR